MDLRTLLPERLAEDVLAGRIRLVLGGQDYILPVRTIRENRAWREEMASELGLLTGGLAGIDSAPAIMARLAGATDAMQRLLRAYDGGAVLPDLDDATEPELLKAMFAVLAAAYPFAAAITDQLMSQPELWAMVMAEIRGTASSQPTSSPPAPTAGRRGRSKVS